MVLFFASEYAAFVKFLVNNFIDFKALAATWYTIVNDLGGGERGFFIKKN
ncbi:hypothetical protein SAMN05720765_1432 [Fibrobacter sp. UWH6]|nr:hypothetical protein SAMN05720765_1432 [Fibrobacter sp. UWH6]